MDKVVVTGATGLVGRTLSENLLTRDLEVHVLGRNTSKLNELEKLGGIPHKIDITKTIEKNNLPNEAIWFHCAAAISGADVKTLEKVNVEGTKRILNLVRDLQGERIIHVSSIAVYTIEWGKPMPENAPKQPYSNYGKSKLKAEEEVKKSGLPYTILRPPFIGGPGDKNFLEEICSRLEKKRLPLINRNGRIGYIDVRDLVQVMVKSATSPIFNNREINVQGVEIGFHEFVETMGRITGTKVPKRKIPYTIAYIAASLVETFNTMRGISSEKGMSRYRVKTLTAVRTLDCTLLNSLIEFDPIPLEKSIKDWIKSRKQ